MLNAVKTLWSTVRRLSGDDAYEQYLKHYAETHSSIDENPAVLPPLLSREEFFKQWQDNKWKGVKRCC
ncbi:MAG TPA: YbdD/YjiX family protein [Methylotenera sp.]|nr:YbdD/YjiX family protein [Methylotenera sp.]